MSKKHEPFSVGDIVRLKSGGSDKTVVELYLLPTGSSLKPEWRVTCQWDDGQKSRKDTYPAEALRAAPKARKKT